MEISSALSLTQFRDAVRILRSRPLPRNLLTPNDPLIEDYCDLIGRVRWRSPDVVRLLNTLPLPDAHEVLNVELVRKSLHAIDASLRRVECGYPLFRPWEEIQREVMRVTEGPHVLIEEERYPPAEGKINDEVIGQRRMDSLGPRYSLEDALIYAEEVVYLAYCNRHHYDNSPIRPRADYRALYESCFEGALRLSTTSSAQTRDPYGLFLDFSMLNSFVMFMRGRWSFFAGTYLKWKNPDFSAEESVRLRDTFGDIADPGPDLSRFIEESRIRETDVLVQKRDQLARQLGEEVGQNVDSVRSVLRGIQANRYVISQEAVSHLLGLGIPALVDDLEPAFDWDRIRQAYGDEQYQYSSIEYRYLRPLLWYLNLTSSDTVYDLGSGYGAMAFYLAAVTKAQVRGVEIVPERFEQSQRIHARLPFENLQFMQGNVLNSDVSDGDVFIIFNPFSPETLEAVSEKLRGEAKKRMIRVVSMAYSNFYLASLPWLRPLAILSPTLYGDSSFNAASVILEAGPHTMT